MPLGDRLPHRPLIVTLLTLTAAGLLAASAAPSLPVLVVASAVTGVTTVVPQIIIPMAAGLVPAERRGAVTGTLLSGLIGGILLARTFSGTLGERLGWRAPYIVAAVIVLALAAILARVVPDTEPSTHLSYPSLIAAPLNLLRTEPDLRRSCLYQATVFAKLQRRLDHAHPARHRTDVRHGRPGGGRPRTGRRGQHVQHPARLPPRRPQGPRQGQPPRHARRDRLGSRARTGLRRRHRFGLLALAGGMLLLDVAVQSGQVANQARIFALRPEARARINTAYMTCAFLGGSTGSWLGVRAYDRFGWRGVTGLVAVLAAVALGRHVLHLRQVQRGGAPTVPHEA